MGIVVEYHLSYEKLPLVGVAAASDGDIKVDVGQPNRNESPVLTVKATDVDPDFESILEESDAVGSYSLIDQQDGLRRYHVTPPSGHWKKFKEELGGNIGFEPLSESSSIVESIRVTATGWTQRRRFSDRAEFADYCEFWRDAGGTVSVRRITDTEVIEDPKKALTDPQRKSLRKAYNMGYFEVPRRVSLSEVADELGVSKTSASELLRRGQERLIESSLYDI